MIAGCRVRTGTRGEEKIVEKNVPLTGDERPVRRNRELAPGAAVRVAVYHDHGPVLRLAARLRLFELPGVKRPVAAATHHDDVSHPSGARRLDHRINRPPSSGSTTPVT